MRQLFKIPQFIAIILKKDDSVFFMKRENTGYRDGEFALPGGMIEDGESVIQAAIREAHEEVGIELNFDGLRVAHVLHRKSDNGFQKVVFFIEVSSWSGELKNCEPDKHGEMKWFTRNDLPENITLHHKNALDDINKNIFFSEDGWD